MKYTVEGYIGDVSLPLKTDKGNLEFTIVSTSDYSWGASSEDKCKRKILLVGDDDTVKMVGWNDRFSAKVADVVGMVASLVSIKASKVKVRIECAGRKKVSAITIL